LGLFGRLVSNLIRNGEIDNVAFLVDHGCVFNEEFEGLPSCYLRAYRLESTFSFELAPDLFGLLLGSLGDPVDLGIEFVVGRRDFFLRNDRAQREVGEHGLSGTDANFVEERFGFLAGRLQVLLNTDALM
jgi:hypothetical protein